MHFNKYRAKKVDSPDGKFDSKREYARWLVLKAAFAAGQITELRRQVPYTFELNGKKICKYISDFVYLDKDGKTVVEDSKGFKTPEYRLKKKLMKAFHDIDITEV